MTSRSSGAPPSTAQPSTLPYTTDTESVSAFLDPPHIAYAARIDTFVRQLSEQLPELRATHDDSGARSIAPRIARSLGTSGLLDALDPLDLRALCLLREGLAWLSPLADAICALQGLGSMPLYLANTHPQWRSAARRGDAIMAFAMTEPQAGSDVANMETRVDRQAGGGYQLHGEKWFISNAGIAHAYIVFAKTDPNAGSRGLSCFLVPTDTPGVEFAEAQVMSAPHPLGKMRFSGCQLPPEALIGDEGRGFALGMASLDRLRPTVAAAAAGMARRALDESIHRVKMRKQFGQALSEFQLVQDHLARMVLDLESSRLLTYRAALRADRGAERITLDAAMAKAHATEAAQRVIDRAVQLHGGSGCLADSPVDLLYRAIRALRIYEGTTEIQHLVIARHLLART